MTLTRTSPVDAEPRQHDATPSAPLTAEGNAVDESLADAMTAAECDNTVEAVTVPLRVGWADGQIKTAQIVVVDLDDLNCEIRFEGQVLGFIHRAGRVFVSLAGTRLDWAEECGQSLLWDIAAGKLVTACAHFPVV